MADVRFNGLRLFQDYLRRTSQFKTARVGLHSRLTVVWRDAADAFIRASMRQILVQTGMSAASYLALSREIKRQGAEAAINQVLAQRTSGKKRGIPQFPSGDRKAGFQGIPSGTTLGKKAYTFQTGSPSQFGFRFSFQTVVFQHAFHEDAQNTINAGFAAFRSVLLNTVGPITEDAIREWLTGRKRFTSSVVPARRT